MRRTISIILPKIDTIYLVLLSPPTMHFLMLSHFLLVLVAVFSHFFKQFLLDSFFQTLSTSWLVAQVCLFVFLFLLLSKGSSELHLLFLLILNSIYFLFIVFLLSSSLSLLHLFISLLSRDDQASIWVHYKVTSGSIRTCPRTPLSDDILLQGLPGMPLEYPLR
jgi:hypothetical protein